jgi:CP family cyanate transporter-like MFS transporter
MELIYLVKNKAGAMVVFATNIAVFAAVYAQYQLPPVATKIMEIYGISSAQFTSLFSAPMIPSIFLSIVAGLLVDKFGFKPVILVGTIITACALCLRVFAGSYPMLFLCMTFSGIPVMLLNVNSSKIYSRFFSPERVGLMVGIFYAVSALSMTTGIATTAMLPSIKTIFIIAAIIGIVSVFTWLICVKETPTDNYKPQTTVSLSECIKVAAKCPTVWFIGVIQACTMGSVTVLNSFLPTVLTQKGLSSVAAGLYASVITIGNIFGSIFSPAIAEKVNNGKLVIMISTIISAVGVALAWRTPAGIALIVALFITGFVMSGLMPILVSIPVRLPEVGSLYAGTAGGLITTLQMIGAVMLPRYVVAKIAGDNLNLFFVVGGGLMIIGFIFTMFLPRLEKQVTLMNINNKHIVSRAMNR